MGNNTNLEREINDHIKTLSRGLTQANYSVAYQGYNALYRLGEPVIPFIKEIIFKSDWSDTKYRELTFYLTGLVCLIHDIDEKESNLIIQRIINNGCSTHIKSLLHSIANFSKSDFIQYRINTVEVLEHREIASKCNVKLFIEKWFSNIPIEDTRNLVRIFIVKRCDIDADALGTYTPMLYKIAVAWDNPFKPHSILFKLFLLSIEYTFYHEIGHHIFRHSFGQDPIQEKDADKYASQIMSRKHPRIGSFITLLRALGIFGILRGKKGNAQQCNQPD